MAYRPDPGAVAIDAFSIPWTGFKFYAFPPFSVITSLLKKIQEDKAEGVCVLPNWPTQPWFPKAMRMTQRPPVKLKACKTLLSLPNQPEQVHPLHKKFRSPNMPLIRKKLNNKNLSSTAEEIIMASWRSGTGKQYHSYLERWEKFCSQNAIVENEASVEKRG